MGNLKIAGCGFQHVAIRVSDWQRSTQFYCEGLGFKSAVEWGEAPGRAALLDLGDGNYLEMFERDAQEFQDGNILHFALRVDDCETAVEVAREAGAEVTLEPKAPDVLVNKGLNVVIVFIKGPDGEVIEFFQCDAL